MSNTRAQNRRNEHFSGWIGWELGQSEKVLCAAELRGRAWHPQHAVITLVRHPEVVVELGHFELGRQSTSEF
nr:MAG TPA: hypothetical protein [Caudoviricetes sp.]